MANQNSSITRVRPFFKRLLKAEPTGAGWLASLLRSTVENPTHGHVLTADPGILLPCCSGERIYEDRILGNIALANCFEKKLPPTERFLIWLIQHPELMSWPTERGVKRTYVPSTQANREMLFDLTNSPGVAKAKADALDQLARFGAVASEGKWWMFEGHTEVDCCLETDSLVLVIEGKRNESLSPATHWFPKRNQLWRNVEAAAAYAAGKRYAVLLMAERPESVASSLNASYPHLEPHEQKFLADHYLGCVSWRDACHSTGIDYGKLPDTNAEAMK